MAKLNLEAVQIRPLHPDDAAAIFAYYSDPRVARTTLSLPSAELTTTLRWSENGHPTDTGSSPRIWNGSLGPYRSPWRPIPTPIYL